MTYQIDVTSAAGQQWVERHLDELLTSGASPNAPMTWNVDRQGSIVTLTVDDKQYNIGHQSQLNPTTSALLYHRSFICLARVIHIETTNSGAAPINTAEEVTK